MESARGSLNGGQTDGPGLMLSPVSGSTMVVMRFMWNIHCDTSTPTRSPPAGAAPTRVDASPDEAKVGAASWAQLVMRTAGSSSSQSLGTPIGDSQRPTWGGKRVETAGDQRGGGAGEVDRRNTSNL